MLHSGRALMNPYETQLQPSFILTTTDGEVQEARIVGEARIEITKFGKFYVKEKVQENGTLNVWVKELLRKP